MYESKKNYLLQCEMDKKDRSIIKACVSALNRVIRNDYHVSIVRLMLEAKSRELDKQDSNTRSLTRSSEINDVLLTFIDEHDRAAKYVLRFANYYNLNVSAITDLFVHIIEEVVNDKSFRVEVSRSLTRLMGD